MKKQLLFSLAAMASFSLSAQNEALQEPSETFNEAKPKLAPFQYRSESSNQTVIWSEDFANGIPQDWTQNGTPALALWEYRGPNTAPPDSVGSRGCWAGPNQSGNLGDPINSPSRSNGFMIFDSDYLHSDGDRATNGQGAVPAPHVGRLRTDTIDLSNESGAELSFYMYARRFQSAWYVAISIDGGATFPDTVEAFPASELPVNSSTDQNAFYRANISNIVANQSEVVLEFVFDGAVSNSNGSGRYYWMIDDIELVTPPENLLLFTTATAPGTTGEAPAHDILFNNDGAYPKYMHLSDKNAVPITFDSNIYNYGTATQTNVGLAVEILDSTGAVVNTVMSPTVATLASFDTAYYTTLTTTAWTPPFEGEFNFVYKAFSDSIPVSTTATADTFMFAFGEEYSIDDDEVDNYFGTNTGTNGMIAIGVLYHLNNGNANGDVFLQGIDMQMSCLTDSTADMEIAIYDTTGFEFNAGFPAGATAIYRKVFSLDGSVPCNLYNFSFEDANGNPQAVPEGAYYVVTSLFPNATNGVIRFANSANWNQPGSASIFQNQNGSWFSGFSNSTTFEAPHYRLRVVNSDVSLVETQLEEFKLYPNPSNGNTTLEMANAGHYVYTVLNLNGQKLYEQSLSINAHEKVDLNLDLPDGVYLIRLRNDEDLERTVKLTIRK
ncbi:MAG: T9SS type A sorting domain-containing protein [Croceimicrobium sp.]